MHLNFFGISGGAIECFSNTMIKALVAQKDISIVLAQWNCKKRNSWGYAC